MNKYILDSWNIILIKNNIINENQSGFRNELSI